MSSSSWVIEEAQQVRKKVKQVAKSRLDLEVTPNMRIGVAVYIKTKIVTLPSLKKRDATNPSHVRMDRTYVQVDNPDVVVENKQTALRYGSEYVVVPPERMGELKLGDQSKCLRVLGFFDKNLFGYHRLVSGCDCVAAEPGNAHAAIALSSLIHALQEEGKVALCRFSGREGSEPKLVVLFPHVEATFECFYAVQAPYSEDSREPTLIFPSLPAAREELLSVVDDFVSSMMLEESEFEAEKTMNPTIHRFYKTLQIRSKDPQAPVPPLEREVFDLVHPEKNLSPKIDAVVAVRPLVETQPESVDEKRKRRFWREVDSEALVHSPTKIDIKRIRIEDEGSTQAESQKAESIESAVREALENAEIGRSIHLIESFRQECVDRQTADDFNGLFRKLLDAVENHPRLWRELIVRGITLISSDEVPKAVTPEQAMKFIEDVMKIV